MQVMWARIIILDADWSMQFEIMVNAAPLQHFSVKVKLYEWTARLKIFPVYWHLLWYPLKT